MSQGMADFQMLADVVREAVGRVLNDETIDGVRIDPVRRDYKIGRIAKNDTLGTVERGLR